MANTGPTVKSLDERVDALEKTVHAEIAGVKQALTEQTHQLELKMKDLKADVAAQLARHKADVTAQIGEFKADVTAQIGEFKADMVAQFVGLKAGVTAQISEFKADMAAQFVGLKADVAAQIGGFKAEVAAQVAALTLELNVFKKEVTFSLNIAKWIAGFAAGIIISLLAFGWSFSAANGELKQKVENLSKQVEQQSKQFEELKQILLKKAALGEEE